MLKTIPVCYSPRMLVELRSSAPQSLKPSLVVADWRANKLPIELFDPHETMEARMLSGHSSKYRRDVLSGAVVNGFGLKDGAMAESQLGPVDAMVMCTERLQWGYPVACAPFGGFVHARWGRAERGCTFNGVATAAIALARHGATGILDFDAEYGDGTADILRRQANASITYVAAAERFSGSEQGAAFMSAVRAMVRQVIYAGCKTVVYQASANQHVSEPRIGMLSAEQMIERDRIVFSWFADAGVKVLWCLGGGHQLDGDGSMSTVIELHRNTMIQCVEVFTGKRVKPSSTGIAPVREAGTSPHFPHNTPAGRAFAVLLWLKRVCGIAPKAAVPDDVYLLPESVHVWRLLRTQLKVLEASPRTAEIGMKVAVQRWMRLYLRPVPLATREAFSAWLANEAASPMDPMALYEVHRLLGATGRRYSDGVAEQIDRELRDKIAAGKAPASLLAMRRWAKRE